MNTVRITWTVMAPLADFANVPRSMVITAFQSASGIVNLVTPTSTVVRAGLALAKVRYDHCLRFMASLPLVLLVACTAFVVVGVASGLRCPEVTTSPGESDPRATHAQTNADFHAASSTLVFRRTGS